MDAGVLDSRIAILRAASSANGFNEAVETWNTLATMWAKATPVSDGERWQAGQTLANQTYRFIIRWSRTVADVTPRDRIRYRGRDYDINGVKDIGRDQHREITATARAE